MKKLLVSIFMCLGFVVRAQEVTSTTSLLNKYVVSPASIVLYDDPVLQQDIWIQWKNGLIVDLWVSMGFDGRRNDDFSDEIDVGVGYTHKIGKYHVTAFLQYFDMFEVAHFGHEDMVFSKLVFSRAFDWGDISLSWRRYDVLAGASFEGGNIFGLEYRNGFEILPRLTLPITGGFYYDDGLAGLDPGFVATISGSVSTKISDKFSIQIPTIRWHIPMTADARQNTVVLGIGLRVNF